MRFLNNYWPLFMVLGVALPIVLNVQCTAMQRKVARDAIDVVNATCVIFHVEMDTKLQDVCLTVEELTPYAKELLRMRKVAAMNAASVVASSSASSMPQK